MDHHADTGRTALYPALEPRVSGFLQRGGHRVYWEESGSAEGVPVLFLHGGPGAGCHPHQRRYFDPGHYRIILMDQRGCGRSTPLGGLEENTTEALLGDMEALRHHLGIRRWILFGGSWGSSLALAAAEARPEHCLGLILRGIFLCRGFELAWFLDGMKAVYPEAWRRFSGFLPEADRGDLLEAYHRRLIDPDPAIHMPAARAWAGYEAACSTFRHDPQPRNSAGDGASRAAFTMARIEAHYFRHAMFMKEDALLEGLPGLAGIPAIVVQGRYDMICPIRSADELVRSWPGGAEQVRYRIIADAGHAASEPGIRSALVDAAESFKRLRP